MPPVMTRHWSGLASGESTPVDSAHAHRDLDLHPRHRKMRHLLYAVEMWKAQLKVLAHKGEKRQTRCPWMNA